MKSICVQCIYFEEYKIVRDGRIGECSWRQKKTSKTKKAVYSIYQEVNCKLYQPSYEIVRQERINDEREAFNSTFNEGE